MRNKKSKADQTLKNICVDRKRIYDQQEISKFFNNYFIKVGHSLTSKISSTINCFFTDTSLIVNNNSNSFLLRPISVHEIRKHIIGMKSYKSTGKFGIPVKYIKIAVDVISPILTKIYNQRIITGSFPDVLKVAEVIPILKAGPKVICSNYRPISLLSSFAKIFEKCLHFQLYNYFTRNNLLNKNQHGFVKKSSTSDAVLDIYNQILQNLNEKKNNWFYFLRSGKSI